MEEKHTFKLYTESKGIPYDLLIFEDDKIVKYYHSSDLICTSMIKKYIENPKEVHDKHQESFEKFLEEVYFDDAYKEE